MNKNNQSTSSLEDKKTSVKSTSSNSDAIEMRDAICLSSEVDNYNRLLGNYQADLYRWLSDARDYNQFSQRIKDEMHQFGLADWLFTRINECVHSDVSLQVRSRSRQDMSALLADVFFECDLIMQHAKICDRPVYQSEVESYIRSAPFSTQAAKRYLLLLTMIKQQGYTDMYCIPIVGASNNCGAIFSATAKGMSLLNFRKRTDESKDILKTLGTVINDVLSTNFTEHVIDEKTRYKQLVEKQPLEMLTAMINWNFDQGPMKSTNSVTAAIQYLTSIRKKILQRA